MPVNHPMPLRFITPESAEHRTAFERLNWAYRDYLMTFPEPMLTVVKRQYPEPKYRSLLAAGETENRPPKGIMRLALLDDVPVGCGTVQTIGDQDAEIKRVYVDAQAQGTGVGRARMGQLIQDCRALGFRRILMDTGGHMHKAASLYDSMGFTRRGPYQEMPPEADGLLLYFEMLL